jgi:hypothetical protein
VHQPAGPGLEATPTPVVNAGSQGPRVARFPLHLIGSAWSGVFLGEATYPWGYLVDVTPLQPSIDGAHIETYIQTWFDGKKWVDTLFVGLPHPGITLDVRVDVYATQDWPVAFEQTLTLPAGDSMQFFLGKASAAGAYVLDVNPLKASQPAAAIVPAPVLPEFSDGTWWDSERLALYGISQAFEASIKAYRAPGQPDFTFEMHLSPGDWQGIGLGPASQEQAYLVEINPASPGKEGFRLEKAVVQPEFDGKNWSDVLRVMIPQDQPALDVVVKVFVISR